MGDLWFLPEFQIKKKFFGGPDIAFSGWKILPFLHFLGGLISSLQVFISFPVPIPHFEKHWDLASS